MKLILSLVILALMLTFSATPVLMNPGFEGGEHLATTYWTPQGGPYYTQYQEIAPPEYWTAWWIEGFLCSDGWVTGRPEVRVIGDSDPVRVRSGSQATKWFTFWRCHRGGLYQQVSVESGKYYTAQAFGHSWFANCDSKPHYELPLDYNCDEDNPILWAHNLLRIGIDSTGGTDPRASTVQWGAPQENYGVYSDQPLVVDRVEAVGDTITIFLYSEASHPLKHCDVYWDDILLQDSTYRAYLPITAREGMK